MTNEEYCNVCGEVNYFVDSEGYERQPECLCEYKARQDRIKKQYEKLSIFEKDYDERTFKNSTQRNKTEKEHKESFERYCKKFDELRKKGIGMLLTGGVGTGKTYYTACIYNELNAKYNIIVMNISRYLGMIKTEGFDKKEQEFQEELKNIDLFIIDDLGSEKISEEWGKEKVFNLFDYLYRNKISFIITSNNTLKELRKLLRFRNSDKIVDRITERCKVYLFEWESRRERMNKNIFNEF